MKCTVCSEVIPEARLKAIPGVKSCVKCSTEDKWSAVPIIHHKTGNEIEIYKEEYNRLNADLDLTRDELSIRGKGGKVRVVFLSDEAKDNRDLFGDDGKECNTKKDKELVGMRTHGWMVASTTCGIFVHVTNKCLICERSQLMNLQSCIAACWAGSRALCH